MKTALGTSIYLLKKCNNSFLKKAFILFLLCWVSFLGWSQQIKVEGYLIDEETGEQLTDILVVNKKTGELLFADEIGEFEFYIKQQDELILSAQGYASLLFSLKDSTQKESYFITPGLKRYQILIDQVSIKAERELEEITGELREVHIESLYINSDGLAPVSSPISYLYTRFSKREERKRMLAQLKNTQRKRILFKELFKKYLNYDASLSVGYDEVNNFIADLDVHNESINYSSKYELLVFVKKEYLKWKEQKIREQE